MTSSPPQKTCTYSQIDSNAFWEDFELLSFRNETVHPELGQTPSIIAFIVMLFLHAHVPHYFDYRMEKEFARTLYMTCGTYTSHVPITSASSVVSTVSAE